MSERFKKGTKIEWFSEPGKVLAVFEDSVLIETAIEQVEVPKNDRDLKVIHGHWD